MPLGVRPLIAYGVIISYNGKIANIPTGYHLCDGTNGTPDLRQQFVKGVLTNSTDPGTTGGEDSHVLVIGEIPVHTHGITETSHSHIYTVYISFELLGTGDVPISGTNLVQTGSSSLAGVSVGNIGGGLSHENRPAYYELLYIMKVTSY